MIEKAGSGQLRLGDTQSIYLKRSHSWVKNHLRNSSLDIWVRSVGVKQEKNNSNHNKIKKMLEFVVHSENDR